jgi:oxygen-independent coproporphyrinogen-3 oxidase
VADTNQKFNLYVHVPFCERLCIYCDFYVTTARKYYRDYTEAVTAEIERYAQKYARPKIETIYFGGGTPSYLPEEFLKTILEKIVAAFDVASVAEITLEANPNNLSLERLRSYRRLGINRLSLGVQSFRDDELRFLTRNHTAAQAERALEDARNAGFQNINLDLIFGLPGQTPQDWAGNLHTALTFEPEHISIYNLTVEERTYLYKLVQQKKITLQDDEIELNMFLETVEILCGAGFEHYEISNYARANHRSQHNSGYWTGNAYLGLGPSAHSFDGGRRWWNVRDIRKYIDAALVEKRFPVDATEELSLKQRTIEFILLNLRQRRGLSVSEFEKLSGYDFLKRFDKALKTTRDYVRLQNDFLQLTNEGLFLYNKICEEFVSCLNFD